jgi:polysaccharide biosynthesis transport protein
MLDDPPIRRGLQSSSPTLRDLAMVLFRQGKVFACAAGMVLIAVAFYAVAGAKYEAQMEVLVRRGRADAPVTDQENAPVDLTRLAVTEEELNSEVELLRDDEVLRKVVEANKLANHDWLRFLRPGEDHRARVERAARRLAKKLEIQPIKKTNLISVSYGSADPILAADVLRSLANVYLLKHTEVHRAAGELPFFAQQASESREQLAKAQQDVLHFMVTRGVVAAAEERDLTLHRLSEVDAGYRQTRVQLAEVARRVHELQTLLKGLPQRTTTQVRTVDNSDLLKALKASLLELELKRTHLLMEFEPRHRLVQEVEQQIKQTKNTIAAETMNPIRDETTDRNSHYEWAKSELERSQVELKGLEAKEAATGTEVAAYQSRARQLGEDAIVQDDLVSTEQTAQNSHILYLKKQESARMDDALDQGGIVNVAIAERPIAPTLPVWSPWALLMIAVAAAGAAGTGAAFAADHLDPAFRTPDEVLGYLEMPVLASLPRRSTKGLLSGWRSVS